MEVHAVCERPPIDQGEVEGVALACVEDGPGTVPPKVHAI